MSELTGLTILGLAKSDPAPIALATGLRSLEISEGHCYHTTHAKSLPGALAQLTRLTSLVLKGYSYTDRNKTRDSLPSLPAALGKLKQLQELTLPHISHQHLKALATLTSLTSLQGDWSPNTKAEAKKPLRSLLKFSGCVDCGDDDEDLPSVWTSLPFHLLPTITSLHIPEDICVNAMLSIAQHCKQLQHLCVGAVWSGGAYCYKLGDGSSETKTDRQALEELQNLQNLRSLDVWVHADQPEVAAIGRWTQVTELKLSAGKWSFPAALPLLQQLQPLIQQQPRPQLQVLKLLLCPAFETEAEAVEFVQGLRAIKRLEVGVKLDAKSLEERQKKYVGNLRAAVAKVGKEQGSAPALLVTKCQE